MRSFTDIQGSTSTTIPRSDAPASPKVRPAGSFQTKRSPTFRSPIFTYNLASPKVRAELSQPLEPTLDIPVPIFFFEVNSNVQIILIVERVRSITLEPYEITGLHFFSG